MLVYFRVIKNDNSVRNFVRKAETEKVVVQKLNQLVSQGEIKDWEIV